MTDALRASLGMYDGGELAVANDRLWSGVAARLHASGVRDLPATLDRDTPLAAQWRSGRLVLGQTCGYPLATRFATDLRAVAAPVYAVDGCEGATHRSFVVVHRRARADRLEDLRGARAVVNEPSSNTGRHLLGDAVASVGGGPGFFRDVIESGSHARSLELVAEGGADVAAIDCVTFAALARLAPALTLRTRILHRTRAVPSLPFVVSAKLGVPIAARVAQALVEALADRATEGARSALRLSCVVPVTADAYDVTRAIAARADVVFSAARAQPVHGR